jgi:hypothetical protein
MRQDPIFSGGVVKAALVLLIAGALGVGAYALVGGDIELPDLPDLPEVDEGGEGGAVTLQDTTLEDTTIDGPATTDTFTSAAFADALAQISEEAGPGAQLTRLFINEVQTQAFVREGDGVEAFSVRADSGELSRDEASISISGNASIEDFAFALDAVDPAAVDRMVATSRKLSGAEDFEPTVLALERPIPFGRRKLEWTINAQGGGRNLLYRADAEGRGVRDAGGGGRPIPPQAAEAEKLNDCVQAADSDPQRILACLERFE